MKTPRRYDYKALIGAVIRVYELTPEPGGERLTCHTKTREGAYRKVVQEWVSITGLAEEEFPFSVDAVMWEWIYFRKEKDKQRIRDYAFGLRTEMA